MGLSMPERRAVTKQMAKRYTKATKPEKGAMLDELCALTGCEARHNLLRPLEPDPQDVTRNGPPPRRSARK